MARKKTKQRRRRSPGWKVQVLGTKAPRRMSDTLVEFARPELLREEGSTEEWQFELKLAAMLWNAALIGKTSEELLKMLYEDREPEPELAALITNLVRRKQTTYARDKRFVAAVEVYEMDDEIHVIAASAELATPELATSEPVTGLRPDERR